MKNMYSFSVYGTEPKYLAGAIQNALDVRNLGPSFGAVFYCGAAVSESVLTDLQLVGGLIRREVSNWHPNGMFWRFQAHEEFFDSNVMFRDTDSRIGIREIEACREWLGSNRDIHIMRDHPFHNAKILGGMWGVKANCPSLLVPLTKTHSYGVTHGQDQIFLMNEVYPEIRENIFVHDSFFKFERMARPFPEPRLGGEYVGESVDELGNYDSNLRRILVNVEKSRFAKLRLTLKPNLLAKLERKNSFS